MASGNDRTAEQGKPQTATILVSPPLTPRVTTQYHLSITRACELNHMIPRDSPPDLSSSQINRDEIAKTLSVRPTLIMSIVVDRYKKTNTETQVPVTRRFFFFFYLLVATNT